jgi:hypothetical protein
MGSMRAAGPDHVHGAGCGHAGEVRRRELETSSVPERGPTSEESPGMTVTAADDAYELAADRAADEALRRLEQHDGPGLGGSTRDRPTVRRRAAVGLDGGTAPAEVSARIERARGGGSALPAPVRRSMEDAFGGASFGGVRLHDGPEAADLSARLGAQAFTVERDVFLGSTMPSLATREGQHTLAHELAHTLQPASSAQRVVQRKIAATEFSKAHFDAQGLKGHRHLFGTSKFAKITALLDQYQAAKPAKEAELLAKIIAACEAWEGGSSRGKDHAAKKQVEEDDKSREVAKIKKSAQDEVARMAAEAHAASEPGQKATALVAAVGAALGLTVPEMAKLSEAELRTRYKRQVTVESGLAQWNKDAVLGSSTAEIANTAMKEIATLDVGKLPAGDERTVLLRLLPYAAEQMSWVDDKHAPGDTAAKLHTPQGYTGGALSIGGNDDYQTKAVYALDMIGQLPLGRMLFRGLGISPADRSSKAKAVGEVGGGSHGALQTKVGTIKPPSIVKARSVDDSGEVMYANSAGPDTASVDMSNSTIGSKKEAEVDPWRNRDPIVGLFHELLHIYVSKNAEYWTETGLLPPDASAEQKAQAAKISSISNAGESRITGVKAEVTLGPDKRKVLIPWDDPRINPLTENQFRIEYAQHLGKKEAWLRPSYVGAGEVPLTAEQAHVTWT